PLVARKEAQGLADHRRALQRREAAEEDDADALACDLNGRVEPLARRPHGNDHRAFLGSDRESLPMLGGVDTRVLRSVDGGAVQPPEQPDEPARGDAPVERGVVGGDEMVERNGRARPEQAREVDVEVPHVADDDEVDAAAAPRSRDQAKPGRYELDREHRHEPRPAQHLDARGSVQAQRDVALEHLVAECDEAFLQDPDARIAPSVVGAEEEHAPTDPPRTRGTNRDRGRMADRHASGIVRSGGRLESDPGVGSPGKRAPNGVLAARNQAARGLRTSSSSAIGSPRAPFRASAFRSRPVAAPTSSTSVGLPSRAASSITRGPRTVIRIRVDVGPSRIPSAATASSASPATPAGPDKAWNTPPRLNPWTVTSGPSPSQASEGNPHSSKHSRCFSQ